MPKRCLSPARACINHVSGGGDQTRHDQGAKGRDAREPPRAGHTTQPSRRQPGGTGPAPQGNRGQDRLSATAPRPMRGDPADPTQPGTKEVRSEPCKVNYSPNARLQRQTKRAGKGNAKRKPSRRRDAGRGRGNPRGPEGGGRSRQRLRAWRTRSDEHLASTSRPVTSVPSSSVTALPTGVLERCSGPHSGDVDLVGKAAQRQRGYDQRVQELAGVKSGN